MLVFVFELMFTITSKNKKREIMSIVNQAGIPFVVSFSFLTFVH